MPLPQAVQRKVQAAADLMKPQAPAAGTPAPDGSEATLLKAEVDRLNKLLHANAVEEGRLKVVAEENKTLKEKLKEKEDAEAKRVEAGELTTLDEADVQLAGPEMVKVMVKAAVEVANRVIDSKIKPLNDRFDQLARMSQAQYEAVLDDEIPDFDGQNNEKGFIAWLSLVDPATGRARQDLLQRAHGAQQGYRVAEIFRAYREKREIGLVQPRPQNIDHGSGGGDPPLPPNDSDKKIWTRGPNGDIAQFYADRRKGLYKDREAESAALERDIIAAQAEGRIR